MSVALARAAVRPAPAASVEFGLPINVRGESRGLPNVVWTSRTALNGHMLIAGGSGTGKSHQVRRIGTALANGGVRVNIIDVHGDIDLPGAHTFRFSESTAFGLNPLEVSSDPDFGGPRKRTLAFVSTLRRITRLGDRQKVALIRTVLDLYNSYGFEADDPRSWGLDYDPRSWTKPGTVKRFPTITDLKFHTMRKLKQMKFGIDATAGREFDELAKAVGKWNRDRVKGLKTGDPGDLAKQRAKCIDAFTRGLEKMESGRELEDLIAWDSVEAVKGLYDRIEGLAASAVFRGSSAPTFPDSALIRRFDIAALNGDEQQLFVDTLLADIFFKAKQAGQSQGLLEVVIIDEAHRFIDADPDHIINVLFREARKFGIGVLLASQSLSHMTEDQISSASVKFILGVDELYHADMERRLGLPKGKLQFLKPRRTALVQVKDGGGDLKNRFEEIAVIA